jgi:hypothetical protein
MRSRVKFLVPINMVVESGSPQQATEDAKSVQKLLDDPMVKTLLSANGVNMQSITVYQPTPAK